MVDFWEDIEVADWNAIEVLLEGELEVDWSMLPDGQDLFVEDLMTSTRGWKS